MTKSIRKLIPIAIFLSLASCAGMPGTADEELTIRTAPYISSTACTISNSNGAWSIWNTPGTVSIMRDSKVLYVTCQSPLGWHGHTAVKSHTALLTPFLGTGDTRISESQDASDPKTRYQSNPTNEINGTFATYPGTIIVPMTPDESGVAY